MTTAQPPRTVKTTCAREACVEGTRRGQSSNHRWVGMRFCAPLSRDRARESRLVSSRLRASLASRASRPITHVFFLPVARIHRIVPRVGHLGRRVGIGRVVSRLARARREGGRRRGDARGGAGGDGERAAEGGAHRLVSARKFVRSASRLWAVCARAGFPDVLGTVRDVYTCKNNDWLG